MLIAGGYILDTDPGPFALDLTTKSSWKEWNDGSAVSSSHFNCILYLWPR